MAKRMTENQKLKAYITRLEDDGTRRAKINMDMRGEIDSLKNHNAGITKRFEEVVAERDRLNKVIGKLVTRIEALMFGQVLYLGALQKSQDSTGNAGINCVITPDVADPTKNMQFEFNEDTKEWKEKQVNTPKEGVWLAT